MRWHASPTASKSRSDSASRYTRAVAGVILYVGYADVSRASTAAACSSLTA